MRVYWRTLLDSHEARATLIVRAGITLMSIGALVVMVACWLSLAW